MKKKNNIRRLHSERPENRRNRVRRAKVNTPKEEPDKFNKRMQKKLAVLFLVVLLAFVGLSVRLVFINKEDGERYKRQVLSQQQEKADSRILPFKRGDIVDAKGTKLAYSEKVYNLVVDAKVMNQSKDALEPTMKALEQCFSQFPEFNIGDIRTHVAANPANQYYVVLKQLKYDEISPFQKMQQDTENYGNIAGIWFEEEYKRMYPYGSLACDVLGFTLTDNTGTYGLEEYYNDVLNGTNGREYSYMNEESALERTTKAAADGNTIVSTIDRNMQSIVEKYILEFNEAHKGEYREGELGSKSTGVIVMNPNNGEILAMAGYPVFDLNNPMDLSAYYGQEEIDAMDETAYFDNLNAIWRNYCISDAYEPGSTAKAMTIAAGLDAGKMTGNDTYQCDGYLVVGDRTIRCNKLIGHGTLSLSGALEQSCNVALMDMGLRQMGKETLMKYLYNFNIGLRTNIDLGAGDARTDTLIYDVNAMVPSDTAVTTFGQGYSTTQIQMAAAFCSVINGGYYYEPHMVSEIKAADGTTVQRIEPRVLKQVISESTSQTMRQYLAAACSVGTGQTAVPAGYLIGGKTGTAETRPRGTENYVVSFIGYAPVDDPQVVVYVVVDRPNVEFQPDSKYAQGIAKGIFTEILPYMNIFKTEELAPEDVAKLQELHILPKEGEVLEPEGGENDEAAKEYEVDPETGNLIHPETGVLLDPETFQAADPTDSVLDE